MERITKKILGFDVDIITYNNALNLVSENIKNKIGTHIVTINPEIIEQASKDNELANIIKSANLVVADGVGIKIALKLKNVNQERIPGVDFAENLLKYCAQENEGIALIGAKEEVIIETKNNLEKKYNGIKFVYTHNGYFNETEENEIINNLSQLSPALVLVATGSPKQDYFIKKCKEKMPNTTFIGIGGAFDVWAGKVQRAPEIFQKTGFEWLYRTAKQPERLKRIYKTLPLFLIKAIMDIKK